jgi:hypothetical protein
MFHVPKLSKALVTGTQSHPLCMKTMDLMYVLVTAPQQLEIAGFAPIEPEGNPCPDDLFHICPTAKLQFPTTVALVVAPGVDSGAPMLVSDPCSCDSIRHRDGGKQN